MRTRRGVALLAFSSLLGASVTASAAVATPDSTATPGASAKQTVKRIGSVGADRHGKVTKITMSGSTSVAPLAEQLASAFVKQNKGKVQFTIGQGGSDIGISQAAEGRVSIGMSSRDPKRADPGGIVFNKFARDAVCIVTHRSNKVRTISLKQIQQIFGGDVTNWRETRSIGLEGVTAEEDIFLATRKPTSGTFDAFQQIFMGDENQVAGNAEQFSSSGLQAQAIGADPNAIGYVSFSFTRGLHNVPYQDIPCTLELAKSGRYDGVRNFYFVTRGAPKKMVKEFISFTRKAKKAQKIIAKSWVPLR